MRLSKRRKQSGFSLVEVMVSVLVTSVSVLGVAGMQVTSKRAGYEAIQRTTATAMTTDMLERMRSNPHALDNYIAAQLGGGTITAEPVPRCTNNTTDACTDVQLASRDLWEWEQALDGNDETREVSGSDVATGGLLNPTGCIAVSGGEVTVTVAWQGQEALSNPGGNTCGAGLSRYGSADEQRQLLSVSTFITDG
ncbi:MAG: type IV pilus modification protein PilV [Halieaceae bacterium]